MKRNVKYYQQIQALKAKDFFVVRYTPTKTKFVLRKTDLKDCQNLEIFDNEFNLVNELKHKNLLAFVTSFVFETQLWTIMPFAEFQSLADLSVPFGLSEEAIAFVLKDVLKGVEYLHNNCIIHHSIRSSNILLFGSPKTEFRCVLSGLKYSINTIRNGEIVTPVFDYPVNAQNKLNWLAPEVLEQNLMGYDIKADIYSIGITCCELSNGSTPFAGLEPSEILLNKLNGEIPEPMDCNSKDLKQFIEYESVEHLSEQQKAKYELYQNRTFSENFKNFVIESCLHPEPDKRLNASELLWHPFIEIAGERPPKSFVGRVWNMLRYLRTTNDKQDDIQAIKALMKSIAKNNLSEDIRQLISKL